MIKIQIEKAGYNSNETIIKNIQFEIPKGEIVGLIGSNGAGKSTTIQSIMGTIPFLDGKMEVPAYGYVPERPILYEYFTLWEHIDFLISTIDQDKDQLKMRAKELCHAFRMQHKLYEYPVNFSKGMQQKVMLILALTPAHDFYILDEPFMGLDPQAIRKLIEFINEYKSQGAAILISTHALDTAEKICNDFVLLHNGSILKQGTLEDLQEGSQASLLELFDTLIEGIENESN